MREIRFRIWHINDREAYEVVSINFELGIWYHDHIHGESQWASFDECVIEQFTGLQDKNSNDIYEGDIVRLTGVKTEQSEKWRFDTFDGVVNFRYGCFIVDGKENDNYDPTCCFCDIFNENYIEVIGNIHEGIK